MNNEKERQEILDRDASQLWKIKDVTEETQPENELQKPVRLPLWTALCSYLVAYLYTAAFFFGFALDRNGRYGYEYGPRRWAQLLFAAVFLVWAGCSVSALSKSNRSAPASETRERRRPPRERFFWMGCILGVSWL